MLLLGNFLVLRVDRLPFTPRPTLYFTEIEFRHFSMVISAKMKKKREVCNSLPPPQKNYEKNLFCRYCMLVRGRVGNPTRTPHPPS